MVKKRKVLSQGAGKIRPRATLPATPRLQMQPPLLHQLGLGPWIWLVGSCGQVPLALLSLFFFEICSLSILLIVILPAGENK